MKKPRNFCRAHTPLNVSFVYLFVIKKFRFLSVVFSELVDFVFIQYL
nr:MAG TPA: hypothetical protein [Caudoviricetes sp.]